MEKFQNLGRNLTKDEQKSIQGAGACSYTWQDSHGVWHTEHGTCSVAYLGLGNFIPYEQQLVSYCHTASHTSPTALSSNGGRSRC
jgi:hypothetical protein